MNSATKVIVILLLLSGSCKVYPQEELRPQLELALNYFVEEKYFDAVTEFKRLVFFDEQKQYVFTSNYHIAMSYKYGGKFSEAIRYFTAAEISARTFPEIYNCKVEIIKSNILRRTTQQAIKLIDELIADSIYLDRSEELFYWKGWAYIFSDNWIDAAAQFEKIEDNHELAFFCKSINDSLYNKTLVKIFSYIVPGSGQIYVGEYLSGLLSFGWNVLWGYLTINAFIEERIFDGFAVGNLLWLRFYSGNIYNAGKFADEKNLEITNRALDYLQFGYKGEKP